MDARNEKPLTYLDGIEWILGRTGPWIELEVVDDIELGGSFGFGFAKDFGDFGATIGFGFLTHTVCGFVVVLCALCACGKLRDSGVMSQVEL